MTRDMESSGTSAKPGVRTRGGTVRLASGTTTVTAATNDLSVAKTGATLLSGTLANVSEVVAPMIALFGGPGVPTGACV